VAIIVAHPDPGPEPDASKTIFSSILHVFRCFLATLCAPFVLLARAFWAVVKWILKVILKIPLIGPIVRACFWVISIPFRIIDGIFHPTWADKWGPEPVPCDGFMDQLTKLNETNNTLKTERHANETK
jgi:hypothetical protein